MSDFLQRLEKEVLIGPGPERLRVQFDQLTESEGGWAIKHPEKYQDILRADFNMGCDYVTAHGAAKFSLTRPGLQDKKQRREYSHRVFKLTKEVIPNDCYLGCEMLGSPWIPPIKEGGSERLYEEWADLVAIALDIGVDFWQVFGADKLQMELCVNAIRDNSDLPIVALIDLHPTPKGFRTMYGADPTTWTQKMEEARVDVVGTICGGLNYEETTAALKEMREACSIPLATKPNAGTPELIDGKPINPATPEDMVKEAPNWVSAGARMVSGCCGTTPEFTEKVIAVLK